MIKSRFTFLAALLSLCTMISSCSVVTGIFKAGMGLGIFIVIAVIVLIVFFVIKIRKNKN